jgi:hypothetical protein
MKWIFLMIQKKSYLAHKNDTDTMSYELINKHFIK